MMPIISDGNNVIGDQISDMHYVTGSLLISGTVNANVDNLIINGTSDDSTPGIKFQEAGDDRAHLFINTSNNLEIKQLFTNKHIVFKVNDAGTIREAFRLDGSIPEVVVNQTGNSLVDFRVESNNKTHALFVDGGSNQVLILSGGAPTSPNEASGTDVNFFVSGSKRSRGSGVRGTAVVGGDLVVSGTLTAIQKHICTAKYTLDDNSQQYIRFNAAGSNASPSVNNKFVAPTAGSLYYIMIRSTGTPGQTAIGFHRATDGSTNLATTPIETMNITMSSADTTYKVYFTPTSNFGPGDIVGLSVNPAANHSNVDITLVFELDFVL